MENPREANDLEDMLELSFSEKNNKYRRFSKQNGWGKGSIEPEGEVTFDSGFNNMFPSVKSNSYEKLIKSLMSKDKEILHLQEELAKKDHDMKELEFLIVKASDEIKKKQEKILSLTSEFDGLRNKNEGKRDDVREEKKTAESQQALHLYEDLIQMKEELAQLLEKNEALRKKEKEAQAKTSEYERNQRLKDETIENAHKVIEKIGLENQALHDEINQLQKEKKSQEEKIKKFSAKQKKIKSLKQKIESKTKDFEVLKQELETLHDQNEKHKEDIRVLMREKIEEKDKKNDSHIECRSKYEAILVENTQTKSELLKISEQYKLSEALLVAERAKISELEKAIDQSNLDNKELKRKLEENAYRHPNARTDLKSTEREYTKRVDESYTNVLSFRNNQHSFRNILDSETRSRSCNNQEPYSTSRTNLPEKSQAIRASARLKTTFVSKAQDSILIDKNFEVNPGKAPSDLILDMEKRDGRLLKEEKESNPHEIMMKMASFEFYKGELEKCLLREENFKNFVQRFLIEDLEFCNKKVKTLNYTSATPDFPETKKEKLFPFEESKEILESFKRILHEAQDEKILLTQANNYLKKEIELQQTQGINQINQLKSLCERTLSDNLEKGERVIKIMNIDILSIVEEIEREFSDLAPRAVISMTPDKVQGGIISSKWSMSLKRLRNCISIMKQILRERKAKSIEIETLKSKANGAEMEIKSLKERISRESQNALARENELRRTFEEKSNLLNETIEMLKEVLKEQEEDKNLVLEQLIDLDSSYKGLIEKYFELESQYIDQRRTNTSVAESSIEKSQEVYKNEKDKRNLEIKINDRFEDDRKLTLSKRKQKMPHNYFPDKMQCDIDSHSPSCYRDDRRAKRTPLKNCENSEIISIKSGFEKSLIPQSDDYPKDTLTTEEVNHLMEAIGLRIEGYSFERESYFSLLSSKCMPSDSKKLKPSSTSNRIVSSGFYRKVQRVLKANPTISDRYSKLGDAIEDQLMYIFHLKRNMAFLWRYLADYIDRYEKRKGVRDCVEHFGRNLGNLEISLDAWKLSQLPTVIAETESACSSDIIMNQVVPYLNRTFKLESNQRTVKKYQRTSQLTLEDELTSAKSELNNEKLRSLSKLTLKLDEYSIHVNLKINELEKLNGKLQGIKSSFTNSSGIKELNFGSLNCEPLLNLINFYENLYCSLFSEIKPLVKIVQDYVLSFNSIYSELDVPQTPSLLGEMKLNYEQNRRNIPIKRSNSIDHSKSNVHQRKNHNRSLHDELMDANENEYWEKEDKENQIQKNRRAHKISDGATQTRKDYILHELSQQVPTFGCAERRDLIK